MGDDNGRGIIAIFIGIVLIGLGWPTYRYGVRQGKEEAQSEAVEAGVGELYIENKKICFRFKPIPR
jgi:hypothetical protein